MRFKRRLVVVLVVVLLSACAGPGPAQRQQTTAPIKVEAAEGSTVEIEAPVTSEQEQEESAIESSIDVRVDQLQEWVQNQQFQTTRYGLDEQTKEFLSDKVEAIVQYVALYSLLALGVCIGAWMIGIVLPKPEMPAMWEFVWWVVGTCLVGGTIILAILVVLGKVSVL